MDEEMKRLNYMSIKYPKYKKYIFDYLAKYGKIKITNSFNIVDSLILSIFSYYHYNSLNFDGELSIKEIVKDIKLDERLLLSKEYKSLLYKLTCPRYSNIKIIKYKEILSKEDEEQFKAYTFKINERTIFISFSGTDNSIIGWKEDFNMAFKELVPSQYEAYLYLKEYENQNYQNIYIGGHSKGGNLAIYSFINQSSEFQCKIKKVFNFDGPGFLKNLSDYKCFESIKSKIIKIVPDSSVVGTLLNYDFPYYVIKSNGVSMKQHYPFYWRIKNKNFYYLKNINRSSLIFNKAVSEIISRISLSDRERFVNLIYLLFVKLDVKTISEIKLDLSNIIKTFIKEINKLNKQDKKFMFTIGKLILKLYLKNSFSIKEDNIINNTIFKNIFYI